MNPVLQLFLNSAMKYLEQHPEEIEKLVAALIQQVIAAMRPKEA